MDIPRKSDPGLTTATVITIILILLIIGVGGYLLFAGAPDAEENADTTPPNGTEIEEDLVLRQTYRNEELGFTIQHPRNITIEETQEGAISFRKLGATQPTDTEFADGISITISRNVLAEEQSLEEYVRTQREQGLQSGAVSGEVREYTLNGLSGYRYVTEQIGSHEIIYLQIPETTNEFFLIVNSSADPEDQGYEGAAQEMIGTFGEI